MRCVTAGREERERRGVKVERAAEGGGAVEVVEGVPVVADEDGPGGRVMPVGAEDGGERIGGRRASGRGMGPSARACTAGGGCDPRVASAWMATAWRRRSPSVVAHAGARTAEGGCGPRVACAWGARASVRFVFSACFSRFMSCVDSCALELCCATAGDGCGSRVASVWETARVAGAVTRSLLASPQPLRRRR